MRYMFGAVWWDYHDKPLNFDGLICLESTLHGGLYTVLMFAFLQKFVVRIVDSYRIIRVRDCRHGCDHSVWI